MTEWQPIETAPIGELVIVCDLFGTACAAYDEAQGWTSVCPLTGDYEFLEPSFWMPLPEPKK